MQNGFREEHSTQRAIIYIVNTIQTHGQTPIFVWCLYRPKKQTFDTVDHTIFPGIMNNCFILSARPNMNSTNWSTHLCKNRITLRSSARICIRPLIVFYILMVFTADDTYILHAEQNSY